MAHQMWGIEKSPERGVRATVKLRPTGKCRRLGMRYRMLRGPWENSGNEMRDEYISGQKLRNRIKELEASFEAQAKASTEIAGSDYG